MSGNEDGVKMVRYAASHIENLCPQVINAARILASRPKSKVSSGIQQCCCADTDDVFDVCVWYTGFLQPFA